MTTSLPERRRFRVAGSVGAQCAPQGWCGAGSAEAGGRGLVCGADLLAGGALAAWVCVGGRAGAEVLVWSRQGGLAGIPCPGCGWARAGGGGTFMPWLWMTAPWLWDDRWRAGRGLPSPGREAVLRDGPWCLSVAWGLEAGRVSAGSGDSAAPGPRA